MPLKKRIASKKPSNREADASAPVKASLEKRRRSASSRPTDAEAWVSEFVESGDGRDGNEEQTDDEGNDVLLALDSVSTRGARRNIAGPWTLAHYVRSPVAKRHSLEVYRKPLSVAPKPTMPWLNMYELLPVQTKIDLHTFRTTLKTLKHPRALDQGGRSLLWHSIRLGDELCTEYLLEAGHGDLIARRDKDRKLDCCDLAVLFSFTGIVNMLDDIVSTAVSELCCHPTKRIRYQKCLVRLDNPIQPHQDTFWYDLFEMMPLHGREEGMSRKFQSLARGMADSEYLGTKDQNGAGLLWHAVRLQDELAVVILLRHTQVLETLEAHDFQFCLDPFSLAILTGNEKIVSILAQKIRDWIDRKKFTKPRAELAY